MLSESAGAASEVTPMDAIETAPIAQDERKVRAHSNL